MVFETLPEVVQNIYLENYFMLFKLIIISFFLVSSILIIKNFKPKQSKYLMVKQIRTVYYFLSWIFVFTIPFHFAYLSPSISLDAVLRPTILFYTLNFIIFGIVIALNVLLHGSEFITELFTGENKTQGIKADFNKYFKDKGLIPK